MKLAEDEEKLAEYYFKGAGDVANMSTLTSRRLVIVYRNAEESYPLSKITAVRIVYARSWGLIALGAFVVLIGLVLIGDSALGGLITLAIGGALVYVGWRGKTQLDIGQMAGHKLYTISGRDPKLIEFMDAVNGKLS